MTTDKQTPIPYVEALSSQFAQLERDASRRSKVRGAFPRLPRTVRGAALAVVLLLASVSGAAAATGLFSDARHAPLTYEERYAPFARPANASDKLPPQARGAITDGAARHFQVDTHDTRQLVANPAALGPGSGVYVARGISGSCVIVTDSGGSSSGCSDTATFLDGNAPPIALLADGTGDWNVIVVLPNASSNVTATTNGLRVPLTLNGNVATGHFADAPTSASWTLADGTTHSHAFPPVEVTPSGDTPPLARPAPTRAFSVFLAPRSAADAIDADGLPETVPGASASRRLDINPSVGRAWLSWDKDRICLTVVGNGGSGTSCGASSFVASNGIVLTVGGNAEDEKRLVVGAVPDGVDDVTLKGTREVTVAVHRNAYASLAGDVLSQEFQHDGTTVSVRLR